MRESWIVLGFVFVLEAACGASCERELLKPPEIECDKVHTRVFWERKLESISEDKGFVFAVYCAQSGEIYSANYDVRGESVALHYSARSGFSGLDMIQSVEDFFEFEFLRGLHLEGERVPPRLITTVDFSRKNLVSVQKQYKSWSHHFLSLTPFFSEYLTGFLASFNLPETGKVSFDNWCLPLTKGVIKSKKPWGKDLLWSVEARDAFVQSAKACDRTRDEVHLIVPGAGIFYGRWKRRFLQRDVRTLFDYKAEVMQDKLREAYPFDAEKERQCINFNDKRKSAKKH